jgi:hypothetical protein
MKDFWFGWLFCALLWILYESLQIMTTPFLAFVCFLFVCLLSVVIIYIYARWDDVKTWKYRRDYLSTHPYCKNCQWLSWSRRIQSVCIECKIKRLKEGKV